MSLLFATTKSPLTSNLDTPAQGSRLLDIARGNVLSPDQQPSVGREGESWKNDPALPTLPEWSTSFHSHLPPFWHPSSRWDSENNWYLSLFLFGRRLLPQKTPTNLKRQARQEYIGKPKETRQTISDYAHLYCVLRYIEMYGESKFKGFQACTHANHTAYGWIWNNTMNSMILESYSYNEM